MVHSRKAGSADRAEVAEEISVMDEEAAFLARDSSTITYETPTSSIKVFGSDLC